MRLEALALGICIIVIGCRKKDEPDPEPARAPIVGTVLSPNGTGVDVVPGASVRVVGGAEVETDERGQFALPPVPVGEPVRIEVRGPRALDPDATERFGTRTMAVTVPDDQGLSVFPHLLRACAGIVPMGGGEVGEDACAGAGGISVMFGPEVFDRPVEVEMVSLDPASPSDVLAVPGDGMQAEGPAIVGAMEVHLTDAATGEPVEMAPGTTARLRFELASLEDVPQDEVLFESYDEESGRYIEPQPMMVVQDGGRRFGEVTVTHFSSGRAIVRFPPSDTECVTFQTEVCRPSGTCDDGTPPYVHVLDRTLRRSFVPTLLRGERDVCIPLRPDTVYEITFRFADPLATTLLEEPVYQARIGHRTRPLTEEPTEPVCPDDCEPLANGQTIRLTPRQYGCARAQLFSAGGDPVLGPIKISVDGDHVSSAIIPGPGVCTPDCANEFCVQVPILGRNAEEVTIEGANGANLQFVPDRTLAGTRCPRTRSFPCAFCDGAGACQDLGAVFSDCDTQGELGNPCLTAEFDITTAVDAGGCTGVENIQLQLDASRSTGSIRAYEWLVDRIDGVDPIDNRQYSQIALADPMCVAPGEYRILLDVYEAGRSWIVARKSRFETLGESFPGPCSEVRLGDLTAPVPSTIETCTVTWDGTTPETLDCVGLVADTRRRIELTTECGFPCVLGVFASLPGMAALRSQTASSATGPFDSEASSVFDSFGNTSIDLSNGVPSRHYNYDDPAQPNRVEVRLDDGSGAPGDLTTVWDLTWSGGQLAEATAGAPMQGAPTTTFAFARSDGRLDAIQLSTGGVSASTYSYAYDAAGNLDTITVTDASGIPVVQRQFGYECW